MTYRATGYATSLLSLWAVFPLLGLLMALGGPSAGARVFGLALTAFGGLSMYRIARASTIRTSESHVAVASLWRDYAIPWAEIHDFSAVATRSAMGLPRRVVAVELVDGTTRVLKDFAYPATSLRATRLDGMVEELRHELVARRPGASDEGTGS